MINSELLDAIDKELQTFQWVSDGRSNTRGEISVNRDTEEMVLIVNLREDSYRSLTATYPVDFLQSARSNIRDLIHYYLCYEADEQM